MIFFIFTYVCGVVRKITWVANDKENAGICVKYTEIKIPFGVSKIEVDSVMKDCLLLKLKGK